MESPVKMKNLTIFAEMNGLVSSINQEKADAQVE
jgi:hypothetical protein